MDQTTNATSPASGPRADEDAGDASDSSEPPTRGFFGRLISAFSAPGDPGADAAGGKGAAAPPRSPQLGFGNLRRLRADDVAIPKNEITAVPMDIGRDELVAVFRQHGFSRLPVYKGSLDYPQGLVMFKDMALQHGFGSTSRFILKKMLRPILFAPPSMPAATLLQKMQKDRVHMALVIDEYGGVDGLVTIEDLIETVIGEIEDEHDEEESALWKEERPGVFLAQATAPLDDLEAALGMVLRRKEDDDEIDTLGGLVSLRAGRVPVKGEVVAHESGAEIEIVEADPRRVKRLRIHLPAAIARSREDAARQALAEGDDLASGEGAAP